MSLATAVRAAGTAVWDQYRVGLGLFVVAPMAVALVIVPEFAQHVVEISIGMFDSRAAAHALANDPTRWAFGYAKLTGLVFAFLACARAAWCRGGGGRWYDLRTIGWGRLILGLALFVVIGSLGVPLTGRIDATLAVVLNIVLSIASLPFLFVGLSGLFGDGATPWRRLLTHCWPAAALLVLLLVTGFAPAQVVHGLDHRFALGQPAAVVWTLMVWDAAVVGALAALTGTAFALGYRAARTSALSGVVTPGG